MNKIQYNSSAGQCNTTQQKQLDATQPSATKHNTAMQLFMHHRNA